MLNNLRIVWYIPHLPYHPTVPTYRLDKKGLPPSNMQLPLHLPSIPQDGPPHICLLVYKPRNNPHEYYIILYIVINLPCLATFLRQLSSRYRLGAPSWSHVSSFLTLHTELSDPTCWSCVVLKAPVLIGWLIGCYRTWPLFLKGYR